MLVQFIQYESSSKIVIYAYLYNFIISLKFYEQNVLFYHKAFLLNADKVHYLINFLLKKLYFVFFPFIL